MLLYSMPNGPALFLYSQVHKTMLSLPGKSLLNSPQVFCPADLSQDLLLKQMFVQNCMNCMYEKMLIKIIESYAHQRYLIVFICLSVLIMSPQPSPW